MEITYVSTRDRNDRKTASEAILQGLAPDGGLYVPEELPHLDRTMEELSQMNYQETAYEVMKLFFTDFTPEELHHCIDSAYDRKFDTPEIAPLVSADGAYYLELFHGKTIAFKDMALSILPYLMTTAARKNHVTNQIVILTATSGDTGKAALAGFADVPGTKIIVFYPKDGVSPIQKLQMVTEKGKNTFVVGIDGNFDEAQTGVKKMFNDTAMKAWLAEEGYQFSSANSINIGRLIPQVAYYVYAYTRLLANGKIRDGEKINVTVPTGNFGNILAAYFAKQIGTPIDRLICASNTNKVLTDFFRSGTYDRRRDFHLTMSPSMDILISSNLERLIWMILGKDDVRTRETMAKLTGEGEYEIPESLLEEKIPDFYADWASEEETAAEIGRVYKDTGYVIDPHTAVASAVYRKYKAAADDAKPTVIASTASPFKFARNVMKAIGEDRPALDDVALCDVLSEKACVPVPPAVEELKTAPVVHREICAVDAMPDEVRKFLKKN